MLYGVMRVQVSGRGYSEINSNIVRTMGRLAARCSTLTASPFSPRHTRVTRPTWEEWIMEETRRRISVVCFLLALIIGNGSSDPIVNPNLHSLPSSKALWESRTVWEWEHQWEAATESDLGQNTGNNGSRCPRRLETVGDFIVAKLGGSGVSSKSKVKGFVGDAVEKWYAEMDGIGHDACCSRG